jgi:hypothetical protein
MRVLLLRNCTGKSGEHLARGSEAELPDALAATFVRRKYARAVAAPADAAEEKTARKGWKA